MRQTEMNDWVGGADPELTGEISASILLRHVTVDSTSAVLDFGAGIGRVAAAVLRQRPQLQSLMGIDIVPRMVDFCQTHFGAQFANVKFELLADKNSHYERFKGEARPKSRADLTASYGGRIDVAYAFSVFTHIDVHDFVDLLRFIGTLLKPGGRFLFTAFILTPFSRQRIEDNNTVIPLGARQYEAEGAVLVGNPEDRLAFIAYDIVLLERMIAEAGLIPAIIEYGDWRRDGFSASFQDVIVCRRPLAG